MVLSRSAVPWRTSIRVYLCYGGASPLFWLGCFQSARALWSHSAGEGIRAPPPVAEHWECTQPGSKLPMCASMVCAPCLLWPSSCRVLWSAVRHPARARKRMRPASCDQALGSTLSPLPYLLAACRAALLCPSHVGQPTRRRIASVLAPPALLALPIDPPLPCPLTDFCVSRQDP